MSWKCRKFVVCPGTDELVARGSVLLDPLLLKVAVLSLKSLRVWPVVIAVVVWCAGTVGLVACGSVRLYRDFVCRAVVL
jgi:hypothetical protein